MSKIKNLVITVIITVCLMIVLMGILYAFNGSLEIFPSKEHAETVALMTKKQLKENFDRCWKCSKYQDFYNRYRYKVMGK